jgi:hypothetical protein
VDDDGQCFVCIAKLSGGTTGNERRDELTRKRASAGICHKEETESAATL